MEAPHLVLPWGSLGPFQVLGSWHWACNRAVVDNLGGHTVHLVVHNYPLNCSADMDPYSDASALQKTVAVKALRPTEGSRKGASADFSA